LEKKGASERSEHERGKRGPEWKGKRGRTMPPPVSKEKVGGGEKTVFGYIISGYIWTEKIKSDGVDLSARRPS